MTGVTSRSQNARTRSRMSRSAGSSRSSTAQKSVTGRTLPGADGHASAVHIVIAPDSFKGSLAADQVAEALADGVHRVRPDVEAVLRPVADGGEGTVAAALRAGYRPR